MRIVSLASDSSNRPVVIKISIQVACFIDSLSWLCLFLLSMTDGFLSFRSLLLFFLFLIKVAKLHLLGKLFSV